MEMQILRQRKHSRLRDLKAHYRSQRLEDASRMSSGTFIRYSILQRHFKVDIAVETILMLNRCRPESTAVAKGPLVRAGNQP